MGVGRIKGDIDNIKGSFEKHQSKIETLDRQGIKMEGRMDGFARDLEVEKKEIEKRVTEPALNEKMKAIQQEIGEENGKINSLNKELSELKTRGLVDKLFPVGSIH